MAKNKTTRKVFATTATAAMAASAVVPAAVSAAELNDFDSIPEYAQEAVQYLVANDYVQGDENNNFNYDATVTRAVAAEVLAKALGLSAEGGEDFDDVESSDWFYNAVVATSPEVFQGTGDGFNPTGELTRQQAAKAIVDGYGFEAEGSIDLPDADEIASWAKEQAQTAYELGIIKGKPDADGVAHFAPTDIITKAEFAVMVKRAEDAKNAEATPEVESVSAINAKEIQIQFTQPVKESTVIDDSTGTDTLKDGVFTFTAIDGATVVNADSSSAVLSEDGKTLTVTATGSTYFNGKYAITVTNEIETVNGNEVPAFSDILTVEDVERPTVTGFTYPDNASAKIVFSEPVNVTDGTALEGHITIIDEDGNVVSNSGLFTLSGDKKSFTVNTSTFDKDVEYTLNIVGVKDFAGNLISPNPSEVTITKTEVDGVKPEVTSLMPTSETELKVSFSEAIDTTGAYFTLDLNNSGVPATIDNTNATVNENGTVVTVDLSSTSFGSQSGPETITVDGYADLSGNTGDAFSEIVDFQPDTTEPEVLSTSVEDINDMRHIVVKFSEEITVQGSTDLDYTLLQDGVQTTGKISLANVSSADLDEDGVDEALVIDTETEGLEAGEYSIDLPAGYVEDAATNGNLATTVDVTLGELSVVDEVAPVINSVTQSADNSTVTVVFDEKVTNATGLDTSNYTVEGQEVFGSAVFIGNKKTVQLTLKDGAIKLSGDYNFTVKNVADESGNAVDVTKTIHFEENVDPVLESAELTANNEVTLTFSEDLDLTTISGDGAFDFDVLVDGTKESLTVATNEVSVDGNTFTITLDDALTSEEFNSTITVEPSDNFAVKDESGNALSTFDSITVTK